ncbi:hypothetical protein F383_26037 [Gossypium arboreum]|uniref:Uncharacterized protein n=1 Tax=Gossypium arboreum TaxID=29729 RepID=A0A0B0P3F6_GOSAR|nr:hypothetical protein F383_26037 [Gossypium arboreum]
MPLPNVYKLGNHVPALVSTELRRPKAPFEVKHDFGCKLRARGSSAKSITLSTIFGSFISKLSNLLHF